MKVFSRFVYYYQYYIIFFVIIEFFDLNNLMVKFIMISFYSIFNSFIC